MFAEPTSAPPRLVALATATPKITLRQADVTERAARHFARNPAAFEWLAPIYRNAEIDTRHSCVEPDWYLQDHSFSERNGLFLTHAVDLLADAAAKALDEAGLEAADIDAIVAVSTTGVATPRWTRG